MLTAHFKLVKILVHCVLNKVDDGSHSLEAGRKIRGAPPMRGEAEEEEGGGDEEAEGEERGKRNINRRRKCTPSKLDLALLERGCLYSPVEKI